MKIDISEVEATLLEKKFDPTKVSEVIRQLEEIVEEIKQDKEKEKLPKQKFEYVIILNDTENLLSGKEMSGWIVQQEADADAGTILSKLKDTARTQNEATKKKKNIITDLVQLFEGLKPKFLKEKKLRIKTKELTRVLITNGKF